VRVIDDHTVFPNYDGNGMYLHGQSRAHEVRSRRFQNQWRVRVNGTAIDIDDPRFRVSRSLWCGFSRDLRHAPFTA
jgi:hypothetical protein